MSRLSRDRTAEPVSRGQGKHCFLCRDDHKQDWQRYPVDLYYTLLIPWVMTIHTCIQVYLSDRNPVSVYELGGVLSGGCNS